VPVAEAEADFTLLNARTSKAFTELTKNVAGTQYLFEIKCGGCAAFGAYEWLTREQAIALLDTQDWKASE